MSFKGYVHKVEKDCVLTRHELMTVSSRTRKPRPVTWQDCSCGWIQRIADDALEDDDG